MKKIIYLLMLSLLSVPLILGYFTLVEYYPKEEEMLTVAGERIEGITKDSLKLTTWNIGYAGMGEGMDFFLDGGSRGTPTKEEVAENIKGIEEYLAGDDSDIFLLQEVDEVSKRTRGYKLKDQVLEILGKGEHSYAYNYINKYVPVPVKDSIGMVKSGVLLFSRYAYENAKRIPLPGSYSWPSRIFHLKRAMLEARYRLVNDKELIVINTHNSAFDKGDMREAQMNFIRNKVMTEYEKGNYVIVGGDWNMIFPDSEMKGEFEPEMPKIEAEFMPSDWTFASDGSTPSVRYAGKAYDGTNSTRVIDGFLLSPNIELVDIKGIDLKFRYSDHNPVRMEIKLKELSI